MTGAYAFQIIERSDTFKPMSRGYDISRDLVLRRLTAVIKAVAKIIWKQHIYWGVLLRLINVWESYQWYAECCMSNNLDE